MAAGRPLSFSGRLVSWPMPAGRPLPFSAGWRAGRGPADGRRDVPGDGVQDAGVVGHAELVGHGEQHRVGRADRLVGRQLGRDLVGLAGERPPEPGPHALQQADLVVVRLAAEVHPVDVLGDRQHAAGHRYQRLAARPLPRLLLLGPGRPVQLDLLGLELVERHAGVLRQQRGALQVQARAGRPLGGGPGARAPPDPLGQAGGLGLDGQPAADPGAGRVGVRDRRAADRGQERLGLAPGAVRVGLALGVDVAERLGPAQRDLRRPAADPELEPPAADQVGGRRLLGHVERVLVAHVDDRGADLDPAGAGGDGRQQRERGGQLALEVMHADERSVHADLLGGLGQLDGLEQRVRRRPGLRAGSRLEVAEGQEADFLHARLQRRRARPDSRASLNAGTGTRLTLP
jgi:hypothetical protein